MKALRVPPQCSHTRPHMLQHRVEAMGGRASHWPVDEDPVRSRLWQTCRTRLRRPQTYDASRGRVQQRGVIHTLALCRTAASMM
jgi:hypothetical protein